MLTMRLSHVIISEVGRDTDLSLGDILHPHEVGVYNRLAGYARADWLCGRVAVKRAYRDYVCKQNLALSAVEVANKRNGQPYICNHADGYCSISHSHGQGLAAVADHPIGVDIEKIRPHSRELVDYIVDQRELNVVARTIQGSTDQLVTTVWTIKEAVMKALGFGLAIAPKSVVISNHQKGFYTVLARCKTRVLEWYVYSVVCDGCCFSIASLLSYGQPKLDWVNQSFISTATASDEY